MINMKLNTAALLLALLAASPSCLTAKRLGEKTEKADTPVADRMLTTCQDTPGWVNIMNQGCDWYARGVNCATYGGDFYAVRNGGTSANQACCDCGGGTSNSEPGTPTEAPTPTPVEAAPDGWKYECQDIPGWRNEYPEDYTCYTISKSVCEYSGSGQSDEGPMTCPEACCKFGGGRNVLVPDVPEDLLCPYANPYILALEEEVLQLVNEVRATPTTCEGMSTFPAVSPLQMNSELRCAARFHSQWMVDNSEFTHESPGGALGEDPIMRGQNAGFNGAVRAENILAGGNTAKQVVDGWLNSPYHCAAMMGYYTQAGVGLGHGDVIGWTIDFGS